jgi:hypothetical protein
MSRHITILTAFWALLIVPTFCLSGILLHNCECGQEEQCGHEEDCSTDPCKSVITASRNGAGDFADAVVQYPSVSDDITTMIEPSARRVLLGPCPLAIQKKPNLPFPSSDIPLLV